MYRQLRIFLSAVQFLTRLPVSRQVGHEPDLLSQAAGYFPAVGVLVGALTAAAWWTAAHWLPPSVALLLSIATGVLLTGAFHEDGLSDFADGFGGGHTQEKVLAIMKDSRVGVYGVLALVLVLWLKYELLLQLAATSGWLALASLVAGHAVSRLLAVSLIYTQRYVRDDESARARPATRGMSAASLGIAALFGLLPVVLLLQADAPSVAVLIALGLALGMRAWLAWRIRLRLGGYTGDCLGAVQQLTEVTFYLGLLAALHA